MHLQRQLGCPGLKLDRWQQSDWIFSLPRMIFFVLAYGSTISLDVGREYCLDHTLPLALHPPYLYPGCHTNYPLLLPFLMASLWLFFFPILSLYHVVNWILSFSGYLDRALLWSPDWLQTQNNPPASVFWALGFQAYTTYSGHDSNLNFLFRSRWITWEEKLFRLFLPIVQSILSNEHISIGHMARCLI